MPPGPYREGGGAIMALLKKAAHGAWHLTPLHVGTLLSEEPIMRERRAVRQTNL
jgi:hypothetical protein